MQLGDAHEMLKQDVTVSYRLLISLRLSAFSIQPQTPGAFCTLCNARVFFRN